MTTAAVLSAEQRRLGAIAVAACAWALGTAVLGLGDAVAYLAPVLALLALFAVGRYPGERAYTRRISRPSVRRKRRSPSRGRRILPRPELPRGGALLATGLAGRAPPA